jgi:hypothetical protein
MRLSGYWLSLRKMLAMLCARHGILSRLDSSNGLINYIDNNPKCPHLRKLTCKGTLRQVFIRVYRLEIQPVMLIFSTQLSVNCCPLTFSLVQLSPSPPFPVSKYSTLRQCVAGKGWGVLSPVGDHILLKFNALYLSRFRTS